MTSSPVTTNKTPLRVCVPTLRDVSSRAFRCGLYEAQDVLTEIVDAHLVVLNSQKSFKLRSKLQRALLYHDISRSLIFRNPGLSKIQLTDNYDLLVFVCQDCWDLPYINAVSEWKNHCKTSVCWVDEIWSSSISEYKYFLHALKQFDHVFIGCRSSVGAVSDAIGQQCHWLPGGVDAMSFSPFPHTPSRVIDVYSVGRRSDSIHRELLRAAGQSPMFYVYDTFPAASDKDVIDCQQHRALYANVAKRSKYFLVAPGKLDNPEETGGQIEVGYRYFEGAAAGTIMMGREPDCEAFDVLFPWEDAVIPINPDGSDILNVMRDLLADPERTSRIRWNNIRGALLQHDWLFRWKRMFEVAGVQITAGMLARQHRLTELALSPQVRESCVATHSR